MTEHNPHSWEPDPRKVGNWRAMFEPPRNGEPPGPSAAAPAYDDTLPADDAADLDPKQYRPWLLQRGRSRPAMMLELRRYEPRSGLWQGWAMSYHGLHGVDFIGDRMLSLDFGSRQFVVEGRGLDTLARHLALGTVQGITEYAASIWPGRPEGPVVTAIRRVGTQGEPPS